jgi:hypothetical protein
MVDLGGYVWFRDVGRFPPTIDPNGKVFLQKVIINEKSETITVDYVTNEQVSHLRNYLIFTENVAN